MISYWIKIIIEKMEGTSCFLTDHNQDTQQKPFECSCGKGYKSYPALYTHIKNKHGGKPPGDIKKPSIVNKKRGRPSTKTIIPEPSENKKFKQNVSCAFLSSQQLRETVKTDLSEADCVVKISKLLNTLPAERMNRSHLNEITSILQMNVYLVSNKLQNKDLLIGNIISKFLSQLSRQITWQKFQQFYTLIMLLVQYIIDQLHNMQIVKEGPVDLLCDFINDFLQIGVHGMVDQFEIGNLSIFKEEVMMELFELFFQWMMMNRYTNYKISLNCGFKKAETCAQF